MDSAQLEGFLLRICSVGETNWKAEIDAFRKGVAEDASHVQHQAQAVAKEGVSRIEHLPQQAAKAKLPPMDAAKMRLQFDQVHLFTTVSTNLQTKEACQKLNFYLCFK